MTSTGAIVGIHRATIIVKVGDWRARGQIIISTLAINNFSIS